MQSRLLFMVSRRKCRNRSSGLTVIDLVISLSLAGILLSLVIPAILHSIERSRQITCRSNLRQVGMAAQQHVSTRRSFPLTSTAWFEGGEIRRAFSPHQSLVAFIDRNMFDQIDSTDPFQPAWENSPVSFVSASNRSLANVSPGIFRCPSDSVPPGGSSYTSKFGNQRPDPSAIRICGIQFATRCICEWAGCLSCGVWKRPFEYSLVLRTSGRRFDSSSLRRLSRQFRSTGCGRFHHGNHEQCVSSKRIVGSRERVFIFRRHLAARGILSHVVQPRASTKFPRPGLCDRFRICGRRAIDSNSAKFSRERSQCHNGRRIQQSCRRDNRCEHMAGNGNSERY